MKRARKVPRPTAAEEAAIARGIAEDPENPEWTDEAIARARPAAEVLRAYLSPEALAQLMRPRGRPKAEAPKVAISLRVDVDVLAHFKRTGRGWQTRINDALRRSVRRQRAE